MPLPDPRKDPSWYGEVWLRYPLNQTPLPSYYGFAFKAQAELRVILNYMACQLFDNRKAKQQTLHQALLFKSKLEHWFRHLPDVLSPEKIVFPSQLVIQ